MAQYGVAFIGWFLWTILLLSIAKNKTDALSQRFNWGKYLYENADNWVVSLVSMLPLVWYMEDICSLLTILVHYTGAEWSWPVMEINYMGCGILSELLYFLVEWGLNKKATLVKVAHTPAQSPPGQ